MATEWRTDWIIAICNTEADGCAVYRFYGSKEEAKQKLLDLINRDKENDKDSWGHGTESVEDVEEKGLHELYAYGCYSDYHIDYTAIEFAHVGKI